MLKLYSAVKKRQMLKCIVLLNQRISSVGEKKWKTKSFVKKRLHPILKSKSQ